MRLAFTDHALHRMFERSIDVEDIQNVLDQGQVVEEYPDDVPFPSRLVVGLVGARCIHVVAADNVEEWVTIVVTTYEPDPEIWEPPEYIQRRPVR